MLIIADHTTLGPVNDSGDTLRSLAESHGHSELIQYLDSLNPDSSGEGMSILYTSLSGVFKVH